MFQRAPLQRFEKIYNDYGYINWKCNYCGWRTRRPQFPKSHQCGGTPRGRTRSGRVTRNDTRNGDREAEEQRDYYSAVDEENEELINQEVPSPFNIPPNSYTPSGNPPERIVIQATETPVPTPIQTSNPASNSPANSLEGSAPNLDPAHLLQQQIDIQ